MTGQACEENSRNTHRIECGQRLNIAGVAELRKIMLDSINNHSQITIDMTNPERFDTAGIQLLYGFVQEARSRKIDLTWEPEIPDQLRQISDLVGMQEDLHFPHQTDQQLTG